VVFDEADKYFDLVNFKKEKKIIFLFKFINVKKQFLNKFKGNGRSNETNFRNFKGKR
jgi:hypothetical protein